jgi:hypothetical protein
VKLASSCNKVTDIMEDVEIRQNKKTLIPMLVILTLALFGMNYYIFFSGKFDNNTMRLLSVFLTALLIYAIYIPTRKFVKNESVLKFSDTDLEINEKGKPVSLLWLQVIDWRIENKDNSGTHFLIVETADRKYKINISWLDKRLGEIEELLQAYKKG